MSGAAVDSGTEFRFIRSVSGTVHLMIIASSDRGGEGVPFTAQTFADAIMSTTSMLCGTGLHVDWTESGGGRRAEPTGQFEDEALCRRCMNRLGDNGWLVFDQLKRQKRAPAEELDEWEAAGRPGAVSHQELMAELRDEDDSRLKKPGSSDG